MKSKEKLMRKFDEGKHICVGLDTDVNKIPPHLKDRDDALLEFNRIVIENTIDGAAAYKLNLAFYEQYGLEGLELMKKTLALIPDDILTIGDAKRGDIGNTSSMYAKAIFDELNFDAITLHPYMGFDSVEPFLEYQDKLHFVLALTSNKSAADFEKLKLESGKYLYQQVIEKVNDWNSKGNCGIVFGATQLEELKNNIESFGDLVVLLPGIGAQGGSLEDVVTAFSDKNNLNYLINVSRGIIYCDMTLNFGDKVKSVLENYNTIINKLISTNS
ncbi:MAG: orotidine-5'-phosphate decarboxylase [Bacteroidetes bacterium]|nr:orotidine-5'-phosphate decarboxylase [Bacteroidota bacterium]